MVGIPTISTQQNDNQLERRTPKRDTRMKFNHLFFWSDQKALIILEKIKKIYQTNPNFINEIKQNQNKF